MRKQSLPEGIPDAENPEWTAADWAAARPAAEVLPALLAQHRRTRGAQKTPTKRMVTLRLDGAVLERWRASGKGWQSRVNDLLSTHAPRRRRAAARLCDYRTGDVVRAATRAELAASRRAAKADGGRGVIQIDGLSYYVEG